MEHPFIASLDHMTHEQLLEKISDIRRKLNFAYQIQNQQLINQLRMAMESYNNAYSKKMNEMFAKQNIGNAVKVDSGKSKG